MNTSNANSSYDNPMYYLEFSIHGTGAEIYLNGIPVHKQETPGTTDSQKTVPESIIDGKNILAIKTFPLDEDNGEYKTNAYAEAKISIANKNAPLNSSQPLLALRLNPGNDKDSLLIDNNNNLGDAKPAVVRYSDSEIIIERSLTIHSPYPRWAWQDGETIDNTPENYESLLKVYKEIYEALKAENKDKTYELYQPAAQEYAFAYDYQDPQQGHRIMNTGGFIGDQDWILGDTITLLKNRAFHLHIFANGHLANIVDDEFGKEPILYVEKKTKNLAFQKFAFYKNKDGKWVMIR